MDKDPAADNLKDQAELNRIFLEKLQVLEKAITSLEKRIKQLENRFLY